MWSDRASLRIFTAAICLAALTACVTVPDGGAQPAPASDVRAPGASAPATTRTDASAAPAAPGARATGRIAIVQWPLVMIDRKELRAAPGARILSPANLTVTPNQVPPDARVQYELDAMGQVRTIWLLPAGGAPQERATTGRSGGRN